MSPADTIERPYSEADVERLRGSVTVEHTLARLGAERLRATARRGRVGAGARCDDGRPGRADGQGRPQGDLPLRLAGRSRREPLGQHVSRPEPLPREQRAGAREAHQQRAPAGRPDHACRGRRLRPLARADRGRRRGRIRRPAQRLRDHEVVHRGRRGGGPLRGPALLGEEVRPPRRQGARPHRPAHPHARRGAARRGRLQRADADRRAHRRPLGLAADERHRRDRPRVLHRRAHAGRASSASATASTPRSPAVSPMPPTPT